MSLSGVGLCPESSTTKAFGAPMEGLAIDGFGRRLTISWALESPSCAVTALTIEAAIVGLMLVGAASVVGSIGVAGRRRRRRFGSSAIGLGLVDQSKGGSIFG